MISNKYHLAQINIARARAPLNDPLLADFMAALDEINALADGNPGFVWRLQTEAGDATELRPYDDDRIIVNLSVWESLEALKAFAYRGAHAKVMRRRSEWFEKFEGFYLALWWIDAGHIPTIEEAKERLEYLNQYGASERAFTFQQPFVAPEA
jgi:heme-degrading monooxygenase HmoA